MQFCMKCGNKLDGGGFCTKCGAKVEADGINLPFNENRDVMGNPNSMDSPNGLPYLNKNKITPVTAILAVAAVVALLVALCFFIFSGRGYKKVVKQYVEALKDEDEKQIVSLYPEDYVDYIIDEIYDGDKRDYIDSVEDGYPLYSLKNLDGDLSKMSYEIIDNYDLDDDEIDDLKDSYRKAKLKIKEGKSLMIKAKVPKSGKTKIMRISVYVVKIDGAWYILPW